MRRAASGWLGWAVVAALAPLGAAISAHADYSERTYDYDRHVYRSPSGKASLIVDPADRYGLEGADYVVSRGGKALWRGRRPYTFYEAVIGDDGCVGGYCFRRRDDLPRAQGAPFKSEFHVVVLAPDGSVRLDQATPLVDSRIPDEEPDPNPAGLFLQPDADRLVVRVFGPNVSPSGEEWWPYQFSTGFPLPHITPLTRMPAEDARFVPLAAIPVRGTPLTLVHWRRYGRNGSDGARFTLFDPEGSLAWRLDLPHDYERAAIRVAARGHLDELLGSHEVVHVTGRRSYSLGMVADRKRVEFAISLTPEARWEVREIARAHWDPFPPSPSLPERKLELAGKVVLRDPSHRTSEIREVVEWTFAGDGRVAMLRDGSDSPPELDLVDANGSIRSLSLGAIRRSPDSQWSGLIWSSGDRFLITRSFVRRDRADGWWADIATRTVAPAREFNCPAVKQILRLPSGGFAVRCNDAASGRDGIRIYARDGTLAVPAIAPDPRRRDDPLQGIDSLGVTTDGHLLFTDPWHNLAVLASDGTWVGRISVGKGLRPPGLDSLRKTPDGELPVEAFAGSPAMIWSEASGGSLPAQPHFADGRPLQTARLGPGELRCGPDGFFWTSDGRPLLRVNPSGLVDHVVGPMPDARRLDRISAVSVGADDRVYATDRRTGSVHAFNIHGRREQVFVARLKDAGLSFSGPRASAGRSGDVLVGQYLDGDTLRFRRDGRLAEVLPGPGSSLLGGMAWWLCQPDGHRDWVVGDEIKLVGQGGTTLRRNERRPDRTWLRNIGGAAVSSSGALGVLEWSGGDPEGSAVISIYAQNGAPSRMLKVPIHDGFLISLALGSDRVYLSGEQGVIAADMSGRPLWRFQPPVRIVGRKIHWQVFLARGGRELWLYDGGETVYRYGLSSRAVHGHGAGAKPAR